MHKHHTRERAPMRRSLTTAISLTLALGMAGPTLAQQAPAEAGDAAAPNAVTLDEVVVTANKRVENIREVASSISVISEEKIESSHATQLSDFQASVPGLAINSNGSPGRTTVSLRGVSPLSSSATVGTYLDETPLGSSGVYQAANFFALDLLPYDIQRIEVLRGPQGTLYGASTMGGLIKYVTVAPDLSSTEFRVGGGLSSVEGAGDLGWDARFGANIPLVTDRVGLRMSYAVNELPGYIDNSVDGRDDINDAKQTSARAALRWQEDSFSLDLVAMRQTIDSDNNAQVALDPVSQEPQFGDLTNSVWVDEPFTKDVDYYSATLNWNLGWADFVSATGYSESSSLFRQDATVQFGQVANLLLRQPAPGAAKFDINLDMDKFTQEFRLVSKADGPFEWMAGVFYTKEDATQTQFAPLYQRDGSPLPPPFGNLTLASILIPSDYKETAVFANGSYRFNDVFKIDAGIRYAENDQEFSQTVTEGILAPIGSASNSSSEDVFTWSVSPQLKLSEDAMIYARVATGYQPGGPNVLVPGLPSQVDSSTLTSYELGLKSQLFDNVVFDLTAFYMDWSDIQVATVVNNISGLVNAGKASSKGAELAASFRITDEFSLALNTAYTDSKLDEDFPIVSAAAGPVHQEITNGVAGDSLPYVPKWSWAATADYDAALNAGWMVHVGGSLRWVGDRKNSTTNITELYLDTTTPPTLLQSTTTLPVELEGYWTLDFNASLSNENWTLRAYARNVTDERAYQSINDITSALTGAQAKLVAAPIQPRTFGL